MYIELALYIRDFSIATLTLLLHNNIPCMYIAIYVLNPCSTVYCNVTVIYLLSHRCISLGNHVQCVDRHADVHCVNCE